MSQLITVQEFARRAGVHVDSIRRWSKLVPNFPQPIKLAGSNRLRFQVAEVEAYLIAKREQE